MYWHKLPIKCTPDFQVIGLGPNVACFCKIFNLSKIDLLDYPVLHHNNNNNNNTVHFIMHPY